MNGPMRDVKRATWESSPRASRGRIIGSVTMWTLALSCGHEVTRYDRSGKLIKPKKARCSTCSGDSDK